MRLHCLVAVGAALVAAAPAQAKISASKDVSPRGLLVQDSDLAAAGSRSALLMSTYPKPPKTATHYTLQARLGKGTSFEGAQRLADSTGSNEVAVGSDGTAVAAWTARTTSGVVLRVAIANPGKTFGSAKTVASAPRLALGGVAVAPSGRALVVFTRATQVQVSIRKPGHSFGAPVVLGRSRQNTPVAAAAPDGTLAVAWLDTPSGPLPPPAPYVPTPALMLAATLTPTSSTFSAPAELDRLSFWIGGPEAASGLGGAAVIWRQTFGVKRMVTVSPGGGFGPVESLEVPFPGAGEGRPDHLALGIPASGPAMALWHDVQGIPGDVLKVTSSAVVASRRPPGGTFGATTRVSASGWLAGQPYAAVTSNRVVAAWAQAKSGSTPRVCIDVSTATQVGVESLCQIAKLVDETSVDVAAGTSYGLVTWIAGRTLRGGRLYLTSYKK